MKNVLLGTLLLIASIARSQYLDLPPAKVSFADVQMTSYPSDTTAEAVVLNELGHAFIDDEHELQLVFQRYVKIKILKPSGLDRGTFEIVLYKSENARETFQGVVASTFNMVNGKAVETKFSGKPFIEKRDENHEIVKFAMPDVRVGSVLEVKYTIYSPFKYNFRTWTFQTDIPKVHSEYWCVIPGIYVYNTSLKGFLRLAKNEQSLIKNCMNISGASIECSMSKYAMNDVPAFKKEEYMTSPENFISSIHFELSEIRHLNGTVDKVTKTWKDADQEMKQHEKFGLQIRRARNVYDDLAKSVATEIDTLKKAQVIYDYIHNYFTWNEVETFLTDDGIKKAFEAKKGNAAEINLSLVGALQEAGIRAFPVLVSTRENGLPTELFPVLSDFNYVVGWVSIGGKSYFLDATSDFRPFGMLPIRCLNGKGRLMDDESRWVELKSKEKDKKRITINLKMSATECKGTISRQGFDYDAVSRRINIASVNGDMKKHTEELQKEWKGVEISDCEVQNINEMDKPVEEVANIVVPNDQPPGAPIYLNPFVVDRWEKNPFQTAERLFPVDFGVPLDQVYTIIINYPEEYEIDGLPTSLALSLPQGGGKYLLNVSNVGNRISITSNLTINKAVFSSADYGHLRELFARVVQVQNSQIVFKKKS